MIQREINLRRFSRRELLRKIACAGVGVPVLGLSALSDLQAWNQQAASTAAAPSGKNFSESDDELLEELERAIFRYFWGQAHPETGIVLDRNHARDPITNDVGSIAATGFGLTALCIA